MPENLQITKTYGGQVGEAECRNALLRAISGKDEAAQKWTLSVIAYAGLQADFARELVSLLATGTSGIRVRAAGLLRTVADLPQKVGFEELSDLYKLEGSSHVRLLISEILLGWPDRQRAEEHGLLAITDCVDEVSSQAMESATAWTPDIDNILRVLGSMSLVDPKRRKLHIQLLAGYGAAAYKAVPLLEEWIGRDPFLSLQSHGLMAIARVTPPEKADSTAEIISSHLSEVQTQDSAGRTVASYALDALEELNVDLVFRLPDILKGLDSRSPASALYTLKFLKKHDFFSEFSWPDLLDGCEKALEEDLPHRRANFSFLSFISDSRYPGAAPSPELYCELLKKALIERFCLKKYEGRVLERDVTAAAFFDNQKSLPEKAQDIVAVLQNAENRRRMLYVADEITARLRCAGREAAPLLEALSGLLGKNGSDWINICLLGIVCLSGFRGGGSL